MLTWILIAVIVAALFGVINFDHIREWSIERSKEAWPYIQKFFRYLGEKMESAKDKVENTQKRVDGQCQRKNRRNQRRHQRKHKRRLP